MTERADDFEPEYTLTIWPPRKEDSKFYGHDFGFRLECASSEEADEMIQELKDLGINWEWQVDSN